MKYVSAEGSDSNPGTQAAPWETLVKVRSAMDSGELQRGSQVLFRRGDTFYGYLHEPTLQGLSGALVLGAYGSGDRPVISGYKISKASWIRHTAGVWKLDITAGSGAYTGNTMGASTNVGFLKVSDTIRGWKRFSLSELENPWDFYSDETYVYVKRNGNPGANVHISVQQDGLRPAPDSHITGLRIEGHGGHGINVGSSQRVSIRDNHVTAIGGSALSGTTRYGNGIECWIGAAEVDIRENTIRETYDVAFTMQGEASGSSVSWEDIRFRNNRVENCNQSFEMWSKGTPSPVNGHIRCSFTDNICVDAGYSWAATIRPDRNGKGTHLLTYSMELPCDVEITRNQFLGARDHYTRNGDDGLVPPGLDMHHNIIKLAAGKKIAYLHPETIEQAARWTARTGKEKGSVAQRLPATATKE
ncbi:right-handed parallel beta-helix repeat-containing protein [Pseudarthrobacter sp. NamB4]|uniref:right-handed parallel beta-helix repeat-containing protein n=1 Tax=Pseudarthrobacter sp. NamB4 TaxID=2576837 RepID=UPI001484C959|nr:right-handed parallel beta-helix repeat-containing protein [Pseudarthrobacter sp. NamB4]